MRHPEYKQSKADEPLRFCGKGIFEISPFFKMRQNSKVIRESYEDYFIDKFKPKLDMRI